MPTQTRSQARSRQPRDLVTSSRADPPRRLTSSRQDNAVVAYNNNEVGSLSVIAANGNSLVASFTLDKCHRSRCMTCPRFSTTPFFKSNVSQKTYPLKNPSGENLNCKSQNVIYLMTCDNCNVQYVGETTTPLNERMNRHKSPSSGCQHVMDHVSGTCVGSTFSVQILENLSGSGYLNDKVCPEMRSQRLIREDYWMKTLKTIYPYGLNSRAKNTDEDVSIGSLFPPLTRTGLHRHRSRLNRNNHRARADSLGKFFNELNSLFNTNLNYLLTAFA